MRILLVEDETDLAQAVTDHFRQAAHAVDHVTCVADAMAAVRSVSYALIVLDLRLPDGNGLQPLRHLRDHRDSTPVLIASAHDRISERIEGLEAGADDYVIKPYDLHEVLARINAILRRQDDDYAPERIFGQLRILPQARRVLLGDRVIALTNREWAILDRLSRTPQIAVAKSDPEDTLYEFGREIESNAIEAHISRLRAKLGHGAITTQRGFGYRMGEASCVE